MAAPKVQSIPLTQVLVDYFDDANFSWHHRLLVVELSPGRWIVVTPDGDIEVLDLASHRVLPLIPGGSFPARAVGDAYVFGAISNEDIERYQRDSLALARVMGVSNATVAGGLSPGVWRVADPARIDFGETIPDADMAASESSVVREKIGLLRRAQPDGTQVWFAVERVLNDDLEEWKDRKRSGPGRDLRIASNFRDGRGHRDARLAQSIATFRDTSFKDWPFRGPKAVIETFNGVVKSGNELDGYDLFWTSRSGVAKGSSISITHRNIFAALSLLQRYDQTDLYNLAAAEFLCRWALQIQAAVRKNPKQPSFGGLDIYLSHSFDESGGIVTSDFKKFVAEEQKAEAIVLKQFRLWTEEVAAEDKKKKGKGAGKAGEES